MSTFQERKLEKILEKKFGKNMAGWTFGKGQYQKIFYCIHNLTVSWKLSKYLFSIKGNVANDFCFQSAATKKTPMEWQILLSCCDL